MRAYRKTTQHPICVYLTAEEAEHFAHEVSAMQPEGMPTVRNVALKVGALVVDPKKERA
ncbi:hypothetical protein [Streptomyces sp. NPDC003832]